VFAALRQIGFSGVLSVCAFGWHEKADQVNAAALKRLRREFPA
jgi:myo-inositol catabolism protein IolH